MAAKLEDGNVRAAIRLLMSDDTPAAPLVESLNKLRQKHPQASVRAAELPRPLLSQCLSVDESEVRRAVLSFPAGSAGGPDGLHPQHIRDMLLCRESGAGFLTGHGSDSVREHDPLRSVSLACFFGGRLLALNKISGGIHSVAIGFTLRHLTSKCANAYGVNHLRSFFQPPTGSWHSRWMRGGYPLGTSLSRSLTGRSCDGKIGLHQCIQQPAQARHAYDSGQPSSGALCFLLFRLQPSVNAVIRFLHYFIRVGFSTRQPTRPSLIQ